MTLLYDETVLPAGSGGFSSIEKADAIYALGEDFYDSIPDVRFDDPVIVIAQVSDGCGNLSLECWELSGRSLSDCFEPCDSFHSFYVDGNGDLYSIGTDLRNGTSYYLFRVFKPGVGRDEQLWLIDLISGAYEPDGGIGEEISRCTLPVGTVFLNRNGDTG